MRLSILEDDSGFRADARRYDVFLDGKKLKHVEIADEEGGFAIVLTVGKRDYERSTLHGAVAISLRDS